MPEATRLLARELEREHGQLNSVSLTSFIVYKLNQLYKVLKGTPTVKLEPGFFPEEIESRPVTDHANIFQITKYHGGSCDDDDDGNTNVIIIIIIIIMIEHIANR